MREGQFCQEGKEKKFHLRLLDIPNEMVFQKEPETKLQKLHEN